MILWLAAAALAQEVDPFDDSFDTERFRPHADVYGYAVTGGVTTLKHLQVGVGLWGSYSEDELVLTRDGQRVYLGLEEPSNDGDGVLDTRGLTDLQVGIGLSNYFSFTLDLPVVLWQSGYNLRHAFEPGVPRELVSSGVGDLRLTPKVSIVHLDTSPVGVAVWCDVSAPTGSGSSFLGEGGWTAQPMLALEVSDGPVRGREHHVRFALNGGYKVRQLAAWQDVVVGNELVYSGALGIQPSPLVELGAEAVGSYSLKSAGNTLELMPFIKLTPIPLVSLTVGGGFGLLDGLGSPDFRGWVGGTFQPSFDPRDLDRDKDGIPNKVDTCENIPEDFDGFEDEDGCPEEDNDRDGIVDGADACPNEAEDRDGFEDTDGCPDLDNDQDGIVDLADRCPMKPETVNGFQDDDGCPDEKPILDRDGDGYRDDRDGCPDQAEDFDGFRDEDGCPDADNDMDGITDRVDKCPNDPEDLDGFEDDDGCPDLDQDGDGIADDVDRCPAEPETFNDFEDDDGCPDERPPQRVFVKKTHIVITDRIYFEYNKATIQAVSFSLLDEIATVMLDHPELKRVRIEGHTDADGSERYNQTLSQKRAESVRAALVERGVSMGRLDAVGFGESTPIAPNDTEEGKATNRRVEFLILERDE